MVITIFTVSLLVTAVLVNTSKHSSATNLAMTFFSFGVIFVFETMADR
jgi:hypothetical protein